MQHGLKADSPYSTCPYVWLGRVQLQTSPPSSPSLPWSLDGMGVHIPQTHAWSRHSGMYNLCGGAEGRESIKAFFWEQRDLAEHWSLPSISLSNSIFLKHYLIIPYCTFDAAFTITWIILHQKQMFLLVSFIVKMKTISMWKGERGRIKHV